MFKWHTGYHNLNPRLGRSSALLIFRSLADPEAADCLLGRHLVGADQYGRHWNALLVWRKYKEFNELRRRIDELIAEGAPTERIGASAAHILAVIVRYPH